MVPGARERGGLLLATAETDPLPDGNPPVARVKIRPPLTPVVLVDSREPAHVSLPAGGAAIFPP
jgi:hypothetical protein